MKKFLFTVAFLSLFFSQGVFAQVNNCLDFDGADDYVDLSTITNNNLEDITAFTIEMWANADWYGIGQTFFAQKDDMAHRIHIVDNGVGKIFAAIGNGFMDSYGYTNDVVIVPDQWFHLAIVYNGDGGTNADKLKIYINGVQTTLTFSGTIPARTPTLTSTPLLGGWGVSSFDYFDGKMDEVRIWTVARTEDEIKKNMNSTLGTRTGLLASYHFDEGTAGGNNSGVTTLNDKSGGTNHSGTLHNFALSGSTSNWVSRVSPTSEDNCLQFDGTDDYVNLAGLGTEIDDKAALTIEMWCNVNTWTQDATLFSKYYTNESRTQIQLNDAGNFLITIEQGADAVVSQAYTTTAPATSGQWFHLAMAYDGAGSTNADKLKLYINGQSVALTYSGTINPDLNSTAMPALLGVQGAGFSGSLTNYFSGKMDEIKIWNVTRTQANIQSYMFAPLVGTEAGLVAYYNFNQGTASGSNSSVMALNDLSIESDWNSGTAAKNFGVLTNFALSGSTSNWISSFTPAGSGTSGDPYLIANLDDLNWLSLNSSKWGSYYRQTADIDASSTSTWNSNTGWNPIGNEYTAFTGTYDGDGHTISGIYINRSSTKFLGFFGMIGAVIQNLGLIDINITGNNEYNGGLVGAASNSSISKCYSTGSVTGLSYNGGLSGSLLFSTVANCYSTVSVTGGSSCTGGFGGNIAGSDLSYCYSTGLVTAEGSMVGGFQGYGFSSISASFWDKQTSGQAIGGGAGVVGKTTAEMNSYLTFFNSGWDFKGESANGSSEIWNIGNSRNNNYPYLNWQFPDDASSLKPGGNGTSDDPYLIATLDELFWITATNTEVTSPTQAARWAAYYKQTADIDASSTSTWNSNTGWNPIGNGTTQFTGTYDGDGHTISGIYINRSGTDYLGFFGRTNTGTVIQNLGLNNINITGNNNFIGGLVGEARNSSISKCYSTGSVKGESYWYIGGLFGYLYESNVVNCYSTAAVTGADFIGGFAGEVPTGSVSDCYSTGLVTAGGSDVGGFAGYGFSSISASFWDTQTSGKATSAGGAGVVGKTTAEMKTQSTFTNAGWDINIWNMDAGINNGYPYLDWQNPGGTPLPVELSSFTATISGSSVLLNWQTATEVNNYGFEVEKTSPLPSPYEGEGGEAGRGWEKIGFVNGNGNSNSTKSYSYEDKNVSAGKYAYRLKQIDIDGKFEYSTIIEVDMNGVTKFELSQNYPNPFNPATTISWQSPVGSWQTLKVYDVLGNEVVTLVNEYREAGNYEIDFDASQLSSGVYIYKLQAGSFTQTRKMTLVK